MGLKIIVSHDIDHWRWSDHLTKDTFLAKYIARIGLLWLSGRLDSRIAFQRMLLLRKAEQHCLAELIDFNNQRGVPATFFLGVANGLSLSYSLETSAEIVHWLRERGVDRIGIHGIAFDDPAGIAEERRRFESIAASADFGIRMHYLRNSDRTLQLLTEAGYSFDSTTYGIRAPYFVDGMLEFPVSVMDGRLLSMGRNDMSFVKRQTLKNLRDAEESRAGYFTINFHDVYFSAAFPDHFEWYVWLIDHLVEHGYEFTDFLQARSELLSGSIVPHPAD